MNKAEKKYHDDLAELGCIACRNMGLIIAPGYVSIHHIVGRSKRKDPDCEMKVLPLCYAHHQGCYGMHYPTNSVRGWEKKYGNQLDLKKQCDSLLEGK